MDVAQEQPTSLVHTRTTSSAGNLMPSSILSTPPSALHDAPLSFSAPISYEKVQYHSNIAIQGEQNKEFVLLDGPVAQITDTELFLEAVQRYPMVTNVTKKYDPALANILIKEVSTLKVLQQMAESIYRQVLDHHQEIFPFFDEFKPSYLNEDPDHSQISANGKRKAMFYNFFQQADEDAGFLQMSITLKSSTDFRKNCKVIYPKITSGGQVVLSPSGKNVALQTFDISMLQNGDRIIPVGYISALKQSTENPRIVKALFTCTRLYVFPLKMIEYMRQSQTSEVGMHAARLLGFAYGDEDDQDAVPPLKRSARSLK